MDLRAPAMITFVMSCMISVAQDATDQELARLLANETTRHDAVARILASGNSKVPLLLLWTRTPPAQIDEYQLYIGMADVFGQLRIREAIPFLIKNISLSRSSKMNTWLKTPEVIEDELPAVASLVRIGPAASRAVIRALEAPMPPDDRLPAIFVVTQIKDPEAKAFLSSALGEANMERYWAEEGLRLLTGKP